MKFQPPQMRDARKLLGALALGLVLLLTLPNLFSGTPAALEPPDSLFFNPKSLAVGGDGSGLPLDDLAFVTRPLFSKDRRPDVPSVAPPAEVQTVSALPVEELEGWSLLGIFNSGEVEGAIIRLEDGSQKRVVVGNRLNEWLLDDVDDRGVTFRSPSGLAQALLHLDLATVTELSLETETSSGTKRGPSSEEGGVGSVQAALDTSPGEESEEQNAPPQPRSFQDIYGDRSQKMRPRE